MFRLYTFLLILLLLLPFFCNAQKSLYVKNRLTIDVAYMRMNYGMLPEYKEKKNGVLLSANYGVTKFLESGLYYYKYNSAFNSLDFTGIQNRLHILPFFIETNNKSFRLDAYLFNRTGMVIFKYSGNHYEMNYNSDFGIGTAFYLLKHVGVRFDYKWGFILSKQVDNHNFQNGFSLGLSLKF